MNRDPMTCGVKKMRRFRGVCFICLRDCDEDHRKKCIQELTQTSNQKVRK